MNGTLNTVGHWLGLCRKQPAGILQVYPGFPPESAYEDLSGGGSNGGSGAIHRGVGAALSGLMMLVRNRKLFGFTLLAGLVLAGSVIIQGAFSYITWTMQPYIGETEWVILNFLIEFGVLFSLVFILAGLVLSVSSTKGGPASFFEGLCGAKKHIKAIVMWSGILAFAGMLLFGIYFYSPGWLPQNHLLITILGPLYEPINLLMEYPFNPALTPYSFFNPSRAGGIPPIAWIYPNGISQALTFSGINLLLFVLTPFVVPLIVIEKKTIRGAVTGSLALLKNAWAEVISCALFLGIIVCGVFFTYLIVQAASGMASPVEAAALNQGYSWIAFALVYDCVLFCFAMVMATVGVIAALNIYRSTKIRQIPGSDEDLPEAR